jgi:hypothetical protein
MIVSLAIGIYLYLFRIAKVHKKQRNNQKDARNTKYCILARLLGFRNQMLNFTLNKVHLLFKSTAAPTIISILLNHYWVRRFASATYNQWRYK